MSSIATRCAVFASLLSLAAPALAQSSKADAPSGVYTAPMTWGGGEGLFYETFNDVEPAAATIPDGWARFGTGGGATQEWIVRDFEDFDGIIERIAFSLFEAGGVSSDWLVTPELTVGGAGVLTFESAENYNTIFGSVFDVLISTTSQTDPAAFSLLRDFYEPNFPLINGGQGYAPFWVDLSDYDGQSVYIAFRHTQNDGDNWLLDNVSVTDATAPAPPQSGDAALASAAATFQFTGRGSQGERPVRVLGANLDVGGSTGTVEVTSLTFSTAGTDDVADIAQARVAYTGPRATGAPVYFGDAVASPDGTFTVTGSREIGPGDNAFVVYYTVTDNPDATRLLDATFEGAVVDGAAVVPTATALDGAVSLVPRPDNDDVAAATVLTGTEGTITGSTVGATRQPDEPRASCVGTSPGFDVGNSVFFSYTPPSGASAELSVTLAGSDFDTVMSFHEPGTLDELACNDDAPSAAQSVISNYAVAADETVLIRVVGFDEAEGALMLAYSAAVMTAGEEAPAGAFALAPARPNPTSGATALTLSLDRAQRVTVEVLDLLGRRVAVLQQGELASGETTLDVAAGALVPGTYLVRAVGESVQSTQRLIVTR